MPRRYRVLDEENLEISREEDIEVFTRNNLASTSLKDLRGGGDDDDDKHLGVQDEGNQTDPRMVTQSSSVGGPFDRVSAFLTVFEEESQPPLTKRQRAYQTAGNFGSWIRPILVFACPLLLCPLLIAYKGTEDEKAADCGFTLLLMAIFWTSECIPIAVTGLLPMCLYPLFGVMTAEAVANRYMTNISAIFTVTMMIVHGFEAAELPRRFALFTLSKVGAEPRWLLAGFMFVPWALSMWMSNTMTTVMLTPIAISAVQSLGPDHPPEEPGRNVDATNDGQTPNNPERQNSSDTPEALVPWRVVLRLERMLLVCLAYSASIGGLSTPIGTGTNLITIELIDNYFRDNGCESPMNFASWIGMALPASIIMLMICWLWLQAFFISPRYALQTLCCGKLKMPPPKVDSSSDPSRSALSSLDATNKAHITKCLREEYAKLDPLSWKQTAVLAHFAVMCVSFLFWERVVEGGSYTQPCIFIVISLFVFPRSKPFALDEKGKRNYKYPGACINWKQLQKSFPFGIILLIGGGIAGAKGAEESGLSAIIADFLKDLIDGWPDSVSVLVVCLFVAVLTEFMSNTACITLLAGILGQLAITLGVNPMYFTLPATLSSSFAFMLPVATPPNAVVFASGNLRVQDMTLPGIFMNITGLFVVWLASQSWMQAMFNTKDLPFVDKMVDGNMTRVCLYTDNIPGWEAPPQAMIGTA